MGTAFAALLGCFLASLALLIVALVALCFYWAWEMWSFRR